MTRTTTTETARRRQGLGAVARAAAEREAATGRQEFRRAMREASTMAELAAATERYFGSAR